MSAIDGYIVRATLLAFLLIVVSLTGVIWITQALRGIDLMTGQGQSILVFLGVTGLAIPLLAMVIAPIALLIAVMHTLNRLATDSEIIVMNAAGLSPGRFVRPFLYATCVVSLLVAFLSLYLAPECMRFAAMQTESADVLTNILDPAIQRLGPLTIRPAASPADCLSEFSSRSANPERINILRIVGGPKNERGSFLILQDGNSSV